MEKQFEKLEKYIANLDTLNEQVSNSSVGWHIDHSLNVVIVICKSIKDSNPTLYKPKFGFLKSFVMLTGYIPRGKAKAPKVTNNKEADFTQAFLLEKMKEAKEALTSIKSYDDNCFFPHPFFGHINKANTVRFLEIHTNHHLKIIRDILN